MKQITIFVITALCICAVSCAACRSNKNTGEADSISGATHPVSEGMEEQVMTAIPAILPENEKTRAIIFVFSFHHGNTGKIAEAMAPCMNAPILDIRSINTDTFNFSALNDYELIGFGSGIDSGKHYQKMLDFANKVPELGNKKAFIFSTSGIEDKKFKNHETLRKILQGKGFTIAGEFNCPGFNTHSFLKLFGGMNKGRPNNDDLHNAEQFARNLIQK